MKAPFIPTDKLIKAATLPADPALIYCLNCGHGTHHVAVDGKGCWAPLCPCRKFVLAVPA